MRHTSRMIRTIAGDSLFRQRSVALILFATLLCAVIIPLRLAWAQKPATSQDKPVRTDEPATLELSKTITREIAGEQTHSYQLALLAGEFVRVKAQQQGVDLVLILSDPSGKKLIETDRPNGSNGPEELLWIAQQVVKLQLVVKALDAKVAKGTYEISVVEKHSATKRDEIRLTAQISVSIGDELRANGKEDALREAANKFGEAANLWFNANEREDEAYALLKLAWTHSELGDKRKALELYEQTLPTFSALGYQNIAIVSLNNMGAEWSELGDRQKSLEYHNRVLLLRREIRDRDGEATTLHSIAYNWGELGERQKALEYYNQVLVLRRAIGDKGGEANTLHDMGYQWGELGDRKKAIEYYDQALILKRTIGDKTSEAITLHNMAYQWGELNERQKALEYYNQALVLRQAIGDKNGQAATLHNMGSQWRELGDLQRALGYYNQALPLRREMHDGDGEARTLHEIGYSWYYIGDKKKALEYYNLALPLRREVGDKNELGIELASIGQAYFSLYEKQKSLEYLEQALPLLQIKEHQAVVLQLIGYAYYRAGQKEKALESFERELQVSRIDGNRANEAAALEDIGFWYNMKEGGSQKALDYYGQAMVLYRSTGDSHNEGRMFRYLAGIYNELEDKNKALDFYQQALNRSRTDDIKALELLDTLVDLGESLKDVQKTQEFRQEIQSIQRSATLRLWNPGTRRPLPVRFSGQRDVTAVAYSPNGKNIASASSDKIIRIWDTQSGRLLLELKGHQQSVETIVFGPNGQRLYSGSWDKTIRIWETSSGRLLHTLTGHDGAVNAVSLSPDGKLLASAATDQLVKIWNANDGKVVRVLKGHSEAVNSVAFSPDGRHLVSGGSDGKILLWNVENGAMLNTFTGHEGKVNSVAFNHDGRSLASGGDDETVRKWNIDDGTNKIIHRHNAPVNYVAYRPDGKYIVSGSDDKTVRLSNDGESFEIVRSILGIKEISYNVDGAVLATASQVESPPTLHALLIGIGNYRDKTFASLAGPPNDVLELRKTLERRSGFSKISSRVVINEKATRSALLKEFEDLGKSVSPQDTVVILYSGHGVRTKAGASDTFTLPPFDYDMTKIESGISSRLLQSLLSKIEARQKFIVLDAVDSSLGFKSLADSLSKESAEFGELLEQNTTILSVDGLAYEMHFNEKAHGILAYALIEGLEGKADANHDGTITVKEINDYATERAKLRERRVQVNSIRIGKDFPLTLPSEPRASEEKKPTGGRVGVRQQSVEIPNWSKDGKPATFFAKGFINAFRYANVPVSYKLNLFQAPQASPPALQDPNKPKTRGASDLAGEVKAEQEKVYGRKGKDYALFVAADNYNHWPKLNNPVHDAETVAQELTGFYGFEIDITSDILRNPKKSDVIKALIRLKKKEYGENDQLFIFVAGHGHFLDDLKEGYIISSDSKPLTEDEIGDTYLSHTQLRKLVDNIPCKHIFLVIDSCFSGTFDDRIARRGNDPAYAEADNFAYISRKLSFKTRRYLTSGGKEYVSDGRPGQHSPFARKFIEALRSYGGKNGMLTINGILSFVERVVPDPKIGEFGDNEPGSDFVFMTRKKQ